MKTVAVIGASNNRRKFGNKAVRGFEAQGYKVVPISSHEARIEGISAYRSVLDVPYQIDMATIYVPSASGIEILDEIVEKKIPEVWINPGADSPDMLQKAYKLGIEPIVACSLVAIGEMPGDG